MKPSSASELLADLGAACRDYMDEVMVDLPCKRLRCDEIWSFVSAKEKNVPETKKRRTSITSASCDDKDAAGSIWTWTAIDDYAMLVKLYGSEPADEARYSPPKCIGNGGRPGRIQTDPLPPQLT